MWAMLWWLLEGEVPQNSPETEMSGTSLMLRKYLIEEDSQNTKVGLKGSENLLKAFVLFLKNIVPFFLLCCQTNPSKVIVME